MPKAGDSRKRETDTEPLAKRFSKRKFSFGNNDPSWYRHYETLTKDVASIVMSRPNGLQYPDVMGRGSWSGTVQYPTSNMDRAQGGFLALDVIPWYGGQTKDEETSASVLNTAASKLYYYIVHGNSRNISYDKSDLLRCIIAFDNLQCVIADAIRAYKFVKAVNPQNKWYKQIVTCLGWDYDDLTMNLVAFRTYINFAIQRFNQISIPDVFDITKAHKHLYDYVYTDRPGPKAQFIGCRLSKFWIYNDEQASVELVNTLYRSYNSDSSQYVDQRFNYDPTTHGRTYNDFRHAVDFILHTLYDSTDMGVMQGDIKRAFPSSQMMTMYMLEEDPDIPIIYDNKEFLLKLHNMELSGRLYAAARTEVSETDTFAFPSYGIIRDDTKTSGNVELLYHPYNGNNEAWGCLKDGVHMMDLPDDLLDDVDSVIQMQLFKRTSPWSKVTPWHTAIDDPSSVYYLSMHGPWYVEDYQWYYHMEDKYLKWYKYTSYDAEMRPTQIHYGWETHDLCSANTHHAEDGITPYGMACLRNRLSMCQLAVTILDPVAIAVHDPTGEAGDQVVRTPLPLQWEVENVTVYGENVLLNILRTVMESLFFASELYNGTH